MSSEAIVKIIHIRARAFTHTHTHTHTRTHARTHAHKHLHIYQLQSLLNTASDTMKHETAERKQDKEGKVIATRKELKYLI